MTRKDYIRIAAAVNRVYTETRAKLHAQPWDDAHAGALEAVFHVVDELTTTLAQDNPRFDRARFKAACTS